MKYSIRLRFNLYLLICHQLTCKNILEMWSEREFGRIKKQKQTRVCLLSNYSSRLTRNIGVC